MRVGLVLDFAQRLIVWQAGHGRHDLPWQVDRDPYRIWLSEIMLQQTQVATVIPYFQRFLARFPDLAALAAAPQEAVMAQWSGLGYYARARHLHACAQTIVRDHGGVFPARPEQLAVLPGIGRSTANAIAVFCFGAAAPILDGNVKRVLCRHRGVDGDPGSPAVAKQLWRLAEELLPTRDVDRYIQAQMDLGATICTRRRPRCGECPVAADCIALLESRVDELPAARLRKNLPERQAVFLLIVAAGKVLLEPRSSSGIWGGLLSLPELPAAMSAAEYLAGRGWHWRGECFLPTTIHVFSHFRLRIRPLVCWIAPPYAVQQGQCRWLAQADLPTAPLPAPVRRLLAADWPPADPTV